MVASLIGLQPSASAGSACASTRPLLLCSRRSLTGSDCDSSRAVGVASDHASHASCTRFLLQLGFHIHHRNVRCGRLLPDPEYYEDTQPSSFCNVFRGHALRRLHIDCDGTMCDIPKVSEVAPTPLDSRSIWPPSTALVARRVIATYGCFKNLHARWPLCGYQYKGHVLLCWRRLQCRHLRGGMSHIPIHCTPSR